MHLHLGQRWRSCKTITYIKHLRHPTTTISGDSCSSTHDDATSSFTSSVVDRHELCDDDVSLDDDDLPSILRLATTVSTVLVGGSTLTLLPFLFLISKLRTRREGFLYFCICFSLCCSRWWVDDTEWLLIKMYVSIYIRKKRS